MLQGYKMTTSIVFCLLFVSSSVLLDVLSTPINDLKDADVEKIQNQIIESINSYRKSHKRTTLTLNNDQTTRAQSMANDLFKTKLERWKLEQFENDFNVLAYRGYVKDKNNVGKTIVDVWYSEIKLCKNVGSNRVEKWPTTAHLSQILWKNAKKMGCGANINLNREYIVVCKFDSISK